MKKPKQFIYIQIFLLMLLIVVFYFIYMSNNLTQESTLTESSVLIHTKTKTKTTTATQKQEFNIWLIFTKVKKKSLLAKKFVNLVYNLINVSSVPLTFHIIIDEKSKLLAENQLSEVVYKTNKTLIYKFYNVQECALKIADIVDVMTPYFSSKPGTYYSDALFYISLGLYRVAPVSQKKAILLDCDLYFAEDVKLLFDEFNRFKSTALFGLAPELSPVYFHILHMYKKKHKTTFGDFYQQHNTSLDNVHPRGFQGYNSGVVLINFEKLRTSKMFSKIISKSSVFNMTEKYKFKGHLGDQDFYTLLGFEHSELIQTINCGFNRQLCTWWQNHGYQDIFGFYFKCEHPIVVLHGNCNTKIPT
ncbi:hypothetical protein HUJ04_002922 [Dendroctonus ponderosae]|uniref:Xyloside xylosyltransferase 1 n=1 Tax=Dendroctonus ponderosae TaxID=77166 RepID=A0AAR5PMI1_DENPD|nr:hypothetical protein HUJ04_002922 [Dendroctonus ponderosae]